MTTQTAGTQRQIRAAQGGPGPGIVTSCLGLVIAPDLSGSHWKDEDDFEEAGKRGLFAAELVARVHANAERCLVDLAARAWTYKRGLAELEARYRVGGAVDGRWLGSTLVMS